MRGPAEATRRDSSTACASSTLSPMASRMSARGAPRPLLKRQARAMDAAAVLAAPASGDRARNGTLQRGGSRAHSSKIDGYGSVSRTAPPAPMRARDNDHARAVGIPARRRVATSATRRESSRVVGEPMARPRCLALLSWPARQRSLRPQAPSAGLRELRGYIHARTIRFSCAPRYTAIQHRKHTANRHIPNTLTTATSPRPRQSTNASQPTLTVRPFGRGRPRPRAWRRSHRRRR